jgi:antitoxin MazE
VNSMKVDLVRIGNSRGVRIPKSLIEQCGFESQVEMRVEGSHLIIAPTQRIRDGWEQAFSAMAERGDDEPLLPDDLTNDFDEEEWEW